MLGLFRRLLRNREGFTLVELMTVLIILGVILGIGVPKYLQVQAKAEWEADESTLLNIVKGAETYAASMNQYDAGVTIKQLIDDKIIDGTIKLNRINGAAMNPSQTAGTSFKNEKGVTIATIAGATEKFNFNTSTGNVCNVGAIVLKFIGNPPYGTLPEYPQDS